MWREKAKYHLIFTRVLYKIEAKTGSFGLGTLPTLLMCWEHFKHITAGG